MGSGAAASADAPPSVPASDALVDPPEEPLGEPDEAAAPPAPLGLLLPALLLLRLLPLLPLLPPLGPLPAGAPLELGEGDEGAPIAAPLFDIAPVLPPLVGLDDRPPEPGVLEEPHEAPKTAATKTITCRERMAVSPKRYSLCDSTETKLARRVRADNRREIWRNLGINLQGSPRSRSQTRMQTRTPTPDSHRSLRNPPNRRRRFSGLEGALTPQRVAHE